MISDHELMLIEAETNFTYDESGRMLLTNEPCIVARRPAPRLWLGLTSCGSVVRFGASLSDPLETPIAVYGGPAFRCPDDLEARHAVTAITASNRELARETYPRLSEEVDDWQPCFAVVRDGAAVAICFSSRIAPRACAAGVDTLASFRGRGFASAVTAAWASAVRAAGKIPLYGTSWDNLASRGVARRLGLVQFGETRRWG